MFECCFGVLNTIDHDHRRRDQKGIPEIRKVAGKQQGMIGQLLFAELFVSRSQCLWIGIDAEILNVVCRFKRCPNRDCDTRSKGNADLQNH